MDQKEYRYHLDNIKCSDEFKNKMEKALASEPGKTEEYEDSVSSVERIHTSVFKRYAAMAAALVLVCGAAGTVWYRASKDKNDTHIAASSVETTEEATTEAQESTTSVSTLPEAFNEISWMTGVLQLPVIFYVDDSQNAHSLTIDSVLISPVAEMIQTLEWTEDTDFDYNNFYILGNTSINEKGQILIGSKVYKTDSAKELADAVYEAFSTSSDFTVNDELFYKIARSTEYYTKLNASVEVIYDSPYSENGNILTINERGEMEVTIDADKVTHEHTTLPSAEYKADGLSGFYDEASYGRSYFDEMWTGFEPGISYTQLTNKVLHKLTLNKHTEEYIDKYYLFIRDLDNETHELVIDPDTGIITEYREYSEDKTYISYKLSNIRYTNDNGSSNINTDASGNDTAQNIIRQHISDGSSEIRYCAERRQDYVQPEGTIIKQNVSTDELKSLLSSCTWSYTSEEFEQKNFYMIEDAYDTLYINEKGQLAWGNYTFATTDHADEIKEMLRGYFETESGSIEDFQKSLIESVSKYDHFTAEGDITFCYDRYNKGIENGVEFEDKCRYKINAPGAEWIVNKNGTGSFSCDNATLDNGSTALSAKVSCEKNGVNLSLTETGKDLDAFDAVSDITVTNDGNTQCVRRFNLTGVPGIETPLPDYQFIVDKALEMIGQCNSNNNYEITEENGIRYLKMNATHYTMTYSCNVDVVIGIDENGMLVRFSEKSNDTTYYDMTLNNITLNP
ncbi:MAG: hypothetical protein GXY08_08840 [Ruminococcus sp.]|nr:hypothetical protein [Ruminococcus sp.]